MIWSKIPKSSRGSHDLVMFYNFGKVGKKRKITTKIRHHQVTSIIESLRKLAWNHLTFSWLNFEKNRRFLFVLPGTSPSHEGQEMFTSIQSSNCNVTVLLDWNVFFAFMDLPCRFKVTGNWLPVSWSLFSNFMASTETSSVNSFTTSANHVQYKSFIRGFSRSNGKSLRFSGSDRFFSYITAFTESLPVFGHISCAQLEWRSFSDFLKQKKWNFDILRVWSSTFGRGRRNI